MKWVSAYLSLVSRNVRGSFLPVHLEQQGVWASDICGFQASIRKKKTRVTRVPRDALKPQALAASAIPHCQTWVMTWSCGFLKIQGRCPTGVLARLARQQRRSPFKIFKPGWGHPSSSQTTGLKMKTTTVVHYSKSNTTFLCFLFCCKFLPVFKCLYETGLQTSNHVRCIFFLLLKRVENVIVSICQKQLFHALSHIPQVNKLSVCGRKYATIHWHYEVWLQIRSY